MKLNQIQVIGTHNSYHAGLAPSEAKLLEQKNPKLYQALEYRHRPLDAQFTSGVRQIELDIYADSEGGRYAHPMGIDAVAAAGLPKDPDFDPGGSDEQAGIQGAACSGTGLPQHLPAAHRLSQDRARLVAGA